jgi:DNA adenine methylase
MKNNAKDSLTAIVRTQALHAHLRGVYIEHDDALNVIKRYDTPDTLFYLDPPYVLGTRVKKRGYLHEMSDAWHQELVSLLLGLQAKVVLSGYPNPLYAPLEAAGWQTITWEQVKSSSGRSGINRLSTDPKPRATECLWLNPVAAAWQADTTALPVFDMQGHTTATPNNASLQLELLS